MDTYSIRLQANDTTIRRHHITWDDMEATIRSMTEEAGAGLPDAAAIIGELSTVAGSQKERADMEHPLTAAQGAVTVWLEEPTVNLLWVYMLERAAENDPDYPFTDAEYADGMRYEDGVYETVWLLWNMGIRSLPGLRMEEYEPGRSEYPTSHLYSVGIRHI